MRGIQQAMKNSCCGNDKSIRETSPETFADKPLIKFLYNFI